ncbi:MAG: thioesterase family protein [Saprospiraceae bacterium]|nr:thioesterase family protein [Saprospiraceae bacterium]
MHSGLEDFPIQVEIPVQWGDMDAARHVNNIIYLRWSESARIAYFEKIEVDITFMKGVGPILGWQDCKYIFPLTYPDRALVGIKVEEIRADRFMMLTHIYSHKHQRLAIISKQAIVPYDYVKLAKAPIPENWLHNIKALEGWE